MKRSFFAMMLVLLMTFALLPGSVEAKKNNAGNVTLTEQCTTYLSVPGKEKVKKWKSDSPEIACIGEDGEVTALSAGTAKITAKTKKNRYTWTVTVEAADFGSLSHENYQLQQVVVLSRHDIRSPFSSGDSLLGQITPHTWFSWSSNPSELTDWRKMKSPR